MVNGVVAGGISALGAGQPQWLADPGGQLSTGTTIASDQPRAGPMQPNHSLSVELCCRREFLQPLG